MIRHILIKDFATIENIEIDFHDGLNIVTGETGAGKSILIEAVSLALGSRADTSYVRSDKERALIQMIAEHKGQEYIITREISSNGKNLCKINGEIVTLTHLCMISKKLADIHGQYDHQSLLNPDYHITLVDLYKQDVIIPAKDAVQELYRNYTVLSTQLKNLFIQANKNKREQDFMQYEFDELCAANLTPGEDVKLEEKISILQNSENIYQNLSLAHELAFENEASAISTIKNISNLLAATSKYSDELQKMSERLDNLYYEFEDVSIMIRELREASIFSPDELNETITRSEVLNTLKMKHSKNLDDLIDYKTELEQKLNNINDIDEIKEKLEKELLKCSNALEQACDKLSSIRKTAALELEKKIIAELNELNFNDAIFSIKFKCSDTFASNGYDLVEFLISTNKGEPLKPLAKIASGGEMSRIMLAFKKIVGDYDEIPTMIFDEIDSGISGIAASVVGKKLKMISQKHQVICITHLPQIAAYGLNNYKIAKASDETMTYTTITPLNKEEKITEIARLLGGSNITETTLKSANELIEASI